jgi:hypothetical protein
MLPIDVIDYIIDEFEPHTYYNRAFQDIVQRHIYDHYYGTCAKCHATVDPRSPLTIYNPIYDPCPRADDISKKPYDTLCRTSRFICLKCYFTYFLSHIDIVE